MKRLQLCLWQKSGCLHVKPGPRRNSQFRSVVPRLSAVSVLWGFSSAVDNTQWLVLSSAVNVACFHFEMQLCVFIILLITQPLARGPIPHSSNHSRYFPKAPKPSSEQLLLRPAWLQNRLWKQRWNVLESVCAPLRPDLRHFCDKALAKYEVTLNREAL